MSIFPFIDGNSESQSSTTTNNLPIPKEFSWDFENNDFKFKNGKFVIVEGLEAIKIWIYKALKTQRYKHLAYSWNYGHELENLVGSTYSRQILESEAKRYVEEALQINPYINSIKDIEVNLINDVLDLSFTAVTDYGEVSINV